MTFIQARDLTVRFPDCDIPVIKELSLDINMGERILLLGPSGSGKSTLLLTLAGLIPRSSEAEVTGQVLLLGQPISKLPPNQVCRKLGFLFQDPESQFCMLYPEDEIAFGLENLAVPSSDMPGRIEKALTQVELNHQIRKTRIDHLSGGQQQRLALGSILAQDSSFILLDEPTANLDPLGRLSVVRAANEIAHTGKGLLVVEHNLDPWFPLLDRLIILGPDGRLLDDGQPIELFTRWGRYLDEIGVWQPKSIKVAEKLKLEGYTCNPLPLNAKALGSLPVPTTSLIKALTAIEDNHTLVSKDKHALESNSAKKDIPFVKIEEVNFSYPHGPQVLHSINLSINVGEFWALVGPNGSGKSTLARTLIKMVKAEGRIEIDGRAINKLKSRELFKLVGYVFQNPEHQFITDSVWEELAFSVRQLDLDLTERKNRIEYALDFFRLEQLASANPFTLSGGQKRRLSVATMLVGGQRLLILDEPTFGQDQQNAKQLMERIAELNRDGVSILMITHDLDFVDQYAENVVVLNEGRVQFSGSTSELWLKPDLLTKCHLEAPFRLQVLEEARERGPNCALKN